VRPYAIGIDLGTTYTAAAVWRDGQAQAVSLGNQSLSIPSVLFLRDDGVFLIGEAAVLRGVGEPGRVAQDFKRRFGEQDSPMFLGDDEFEPAVLTGHLLRWVVDQVVQVEGGAPDHVTLTCPATWGDYRRDLLRQAAETAKLTSVGLLVEPVAAAVYYASQQRIQAGDRVAVYDLGGGTFDATIVEKTADGFEIQGTPVGTESIGGRNFDAAVMHHVETVIKIPWRNWDADDPDVLRSLAVIRDNAVRAKEQLSFDTEAYVPVTLPELSRSVRITRGEFESAVRLPIYKTITLMLQAVEDVGLQRSDLSSVLLIGGSSRIPLVSQLLATEFAVPIKVDSHPKYAVCLGAAVSSSLRLPESSRPARASEPTLPIDAGPAVGPPGGVGTGAVEGGPDLASSPPHDASGDDGVELLASYTTIHVAVEETGLSAPVDVEVEVVPDESAPAPTVLDEDRPLEATYIGVPKAWRIALVTLAAVAVAVGLTIGAAAILSDSSKDEGTRQPQATAPRTPSVRVGSDVTLTPMPVDGAAAAVMSDLARATNGTVLAVGSAIGAEPATHAPRVWRLSADGWQRTFEPAETGAAMNGIAAGTGKAPSFVAVGWAAAPGSTDPDQQDRHAAIWTSKDGATWAPVAPPDDTGELFDVAALPAGGFVATGLVWSEGADGEVVILTSPSGKAWRALPAPGLSGPDEVRVTRLLPGTGGAILAVGSAQIGGVSPSVLLRRNTEGDWVRSVQAFESPTAAPVRARGVGRTAKGAYVIVGDSQASDGAREPAVWTFDAAANDPGDAVFRDSPTEGGLTSVLQTPRGLVVVGQTAGVDGTPTAAAWLLTGL
jgi:molecular chaperone DnaK